MNGGESYDNAPIRAAIANLADAPDDDGHSADGQEFGVLREFITYFRIGFLAWGQQ